MKRGAEFATIVLGILIFIDDYFNCLTVGSIMRPVTDRFHVSRAKLAYLIDATAAPVCIIAPISSWAATVSGFVPGNQNGIALFVQCIPWNFYALFTIAFMFAITAMGADYGLMEKHEINADNGDLYTTEERPFPEMPEDEDAEIKGSLSDMLVPVIVLIICCVVGMIWSGGFFSGKNVVDAFSGSDASVGLGVGAFFGLIITLLWYLPRKVMHSQNSWRAFPRDLRQ